MRTTLFDLETVENIEFDTIRENQNLITQN
jgi:hypothetical protein